MNREERQFRHRAVIVLSWVGAVSSVLFTFVNLKRGIAHIAMVDMGMLVAFLTNLFVYRKIGNPSRAGGIGLGIVMAFVMLATPTLGVAALAWVYIIPIPAFYFMGLRFGKVFATFWGLVILGMITLFDAPAGMHIGLKLELLAVYVLASLTAYMLESLREKNALEIRRLAREAQQANEAKDRFLAQMSHELRTPLNAILGFNQIIQHRPTLPDDLAPYIEKIHESGTDLLWMVDSILDYTQLTTGSMEVREQEVELTELMNEAVEKCQPMMKAADVSLRSERLEGVRIRGDRRLLDQALVRMLLHAVKNAPRTGEVVVDCRLDGELYLTMSDTGEASSARRDLSTDDPFGTAADTELPHAVDLSLGLAITHLVAIAHGGRLDMFCDRPSDSCLRLSLPASRLISRAEEAAPEPAPESLRV